MPAKAGIQSRIALVLRPTIILTVLAPWGPFTGVAAYYVYILASCRNGTLYIGVTNDLARRVYEHQEGIVEGFTKRYGVHHLVYYEVHKDVRDAIWREKCIKRWRRAWKIRLIEQENPDWRDLPL